MPSVNPSPFGPKPQFTLSSGLPSIGGQLFFYVAGSTGTKQSTYTDSTGNTANTNPLVLNSLGEPTTQIWFAAGLTYKVVYAPVDDTDPPSSPIWTIDNLAGINDTTTAADQWSASGLTPTYIAASSFSVPGDQTSIFQVGRRLKATVSAGTKYGTIGTSAFGAGITTVGVTIDNGSALDSGLSAVSYGVLTATNSSVPAPFFAGAVANLTTVNGTNTITAIATAISSYVTGQTYKFVPANTNTGATTLNVSGLGAKNVFCGGAACTGGEIRQSIPVIVHYDGTQFNIIGPYAGGRVPGPILQSGTGDVNFRGATNIGGTTAASALTPSSAVVVNYDQNYDNGARIFAAAATNNPLIVHNTDTAGDNLFVTFRTEAIGTPSDRGSIDFNRGGTAVRYNTTSDGRLKTKHGPAKYDSEWIGKVAACVFDVTWNESQYRTNAFIAQDLYEVEPSEVRKGDDGELGPDSVIWGVNKTGLIEGLLLEVAALRKRLDEM